jgi:hypothetical protein
VGWSDQQIVDAVRDVLERGETEIRRAPTKLQQDRQGNQWLPTFDYLVTKTARIKGEEIIATYTVIYGVAVQPYGYSTERQ